MSHKIDYETKNAIPCCQWKPTTKTEYTKHMWIRDIRTFYLQDTSPTREFACSLDSSPTGFHVVYALI